MGLPFRLRCFLMHLILSSLIIFVLWLLIFRLWYIPPLSVAVDIRQMMVLVVVVDMILGPLLTLMLAKQGKKGLKFDFFVIGLLQVLALAYGVYNVARARPVWLAFDLNRFELVQAYMVDRGQNDQTANEMYKTEGWFIPQWVSVRPAKDGEEQSDWLFYELEKSISPAMRPHLYEPVEKNINRVIEAKQPLSDLQRFNESKSVEKVLSQYSQADGFLPMRASRVDMTVLVDSKNKQIVGVVDLRPW